jgi:hypothetical protein
MTSIYDELSGKIATASGRASRDGARRDLGLLLFADRDAIRDLWNAADRYAAKLGEDLPPELRSAIESLRPLFGERSG